MKRLLVIGIGAGDPDHLTLQAVAALKTIDVFFVPDKGDEKGDLKDARLDAIARFAEPGRSRTVVVTMPVRDATGDYAAAVGDWHRAIASAYSAAFRSVDQEEYGALLVWGDPSLYDSTLRLLDTLRAQGACPEVQVIPGITAIQALCARHRIPLNSIGEPVLITTGRKLGVAMPADVGSVVVMLDGVQAFADIEDHGVEIFWGAYLGTPDEKLIAGPLAAVKGDILRMRAAERGRKGWIMDTYLLRRTGGATTNPDA